MIPSVIAHQIQYGIEDYLRTTFPPESPFFQDILETLFRDPKGIFRGPYLTLKLPFRPGTGHSKSLFPEIPMKYPPYLHQERAFERLASPAPRSTIVATGTGSGKTECFMYPILDHCWKSRNEPGIKAIIIYPMNALATDQARRFASEIFHNSDLKGNVTVGLFIGGEEGAGGSSAMKEDSVITSKETMRKNPPNILLTNYRMLDLLLLRPKDYPLWRDNQPDTLQYIAVDELHTFDGAQGSDLASLLRRLYARLRTESDSLCCIGTSATLGDDQESREKVMAFAHELFGASFDSDSVITEDLLKPHEFLGDSLVQPWTVPDETQTERLSPMKYATEGEYLCAQSRLWFPQEYALSQEPDEEERVELGRGLCQHSFFQNFLRLVKDKTLDWEEMIRVLEPLQPGISKQTQEYQSYLLNSLTALISYARRKITASDGSEPYVPFLNLRCQLWLRELRRMVATVEKEPRLLFDDDIKPDHESESLPLVHCRSCGQVGYLTVQSLVGNRYSTDLNAIYTAFFGRSPNLVVFFHDDRAEEPLPEEERTQRSFRQFLCGRCLTSYEGEKLEECPNCGQKETLIPVKIEKPFSRQTGKDATRDCPNCGGSDTLAIIGARAASLISVAMSQLFATPFNDDKKLLTFSDSVQDAAHRAVFYEARTFRFNLRAAIQQFVSRTTNRMTLAQLPDRFVEYWRQELGTPEAFVAQFIPPDLQNREFNDFAELKNNGTLPAQSDLLTKVTHRIHWEILSEYGFRARIGRTLEKTGCSILALNAEGREAWVEEVHRKLTNEFGFLRDLSSDAIRQFLLGIVRLMRIRGGFSADYLTGYQKGGNLYQLKIDAPFLPYFGKKRAPIFLQETSGIPRFDTVVSEGRNRQTVYHKWLTPFLGNRVVSDRNLYSDIFHIVFESGKKIGIISEVVSSRGKVWGLNPECFEIEREVESFVCSQTNHQISVPKSESPFWEDMPSQRFDATIGRYHRMRTTQEDSDRRNYYKNLYSQGEVHRVIAREHTGLLSREDREDLEKEFIDGGGVAAVNTLSCTPTLEMGINIGDLSSIFLCSVPPTKSNYLQRIGRGGRRDGNSIHLVIANGAPHDLHFFNEPEEMFASAVTPPGIFLNAPAVLQRQLIAYCFDRWIEEVEGNLQAIPMELKAVLDAVQGNEVDKFPYTFFRFIELNRTELFDGFCQIFGGVLLEETQESLRQFFYGFGSEGRIEVKILEDMKRVSAIREKCQKQLTTITNRLSALKKKPKDQDLEDEEKDLEIEKKGMKRRIEDLNKKQTFNFFTDEGLLPNYAFPETGVTLRSVLYWENRKRSGDKYQTLTGEYERSAQTAISELAPGNHFYVQGRKLTINRIDMASVVKEEWHFCDQCNHIEKTGEGETHSVSCPICGSAGWVNGELKRTVLKLRQVIANQKESDTRFEDDAEQRTPKFFNSRIMIHFNPNDVTHAYRFDDERTPFGFEYIRKVDFREINFGESQKEEGNELTIAGEKIGRQGFRVCSECGMVQLDENTLKHHVSCKHYYKNSETPIIPCVYLYREFQSEAIRILLPVDSLDLGVKIPSLIAAIYMGLKEKYAGNVDHILITKQEERVEGSSFRKCFLVLYDQVPGGTGYLKGLAQSKENLIELLQLAYQKLKTCSCQSDPEKDGCYRCLYAYKTSRNMNKISSRSAMEVLGALVAQKEKFIETDTIANIPVNVLFESELEKRFVEGIRRYFSQTPQLTMEKRILDGRPGYLMKIPSKKDPEKVYFYEMIPQYELGTNDGVSVPSRADFLIRGMNQPAFKPIAIFTDGYAFHGDIQSPNYRLPTDLTQRMAIARSQKWLSWSLTYEDVVSFCEKKSAPHFAPICSMDRLFMKDSIDHQWRQLPAKDSFSMLIELLENPDFENWNQVARRLIVSISRPIYVSEETIDALQTLMTSETDLTKLEAAFERISPSSSGTHILWKNHFSSPSGDSFYLAYMRKEDVTQFLKKEGLLHTLIRFNDTPIGDIDAKAFKWEWNSLLQRYNLLQFNPHTTVLTSKMAADQTPIPKELEEIEEEDWSELFELTDESVHSFLDEIRRIGAPLPTAGFEFEDATGQVVGIAELAWLESKVAILLSAEDLPSSLQDSWRVFTVGEENWIEQAKTLLDERMKLWR